MKRIIFTIVFVLWTSTLFAQYKMSIKNADNTTQDIWIHNITEITFTDVDFTCGTNTITYAGQTYNTVLIGGSQCWLKENLNIGTKINGSSNQTDNGTLEKYCYDDSDSKCTSHGGLYQWDEAMQYVTTAGAQGICPTGWHIPTSAEFNTLSTSVSGDPDALLKVGEGEGTNTSGFTALYAGYRSSDGSFYDLSTFTGRTNFWSSTNYNANNAYSLILTQVDPDDITIDYFGKTYGFSVRCLKD